jgi:hypothetical protein
MGDVLLVGDNAGWVHAYDKRTGAELRQYGYPLRLSEEPYREGDQGEQWWEPVGGTATQMTVAAGLLLAGVNSETEERTVLRAFRMQPTPPGGEEPENPGGPENPGNPENPPGGGTPKIDLTLRTLQVPETAEANRGFTARVTAVCTSCTGPVTTTVSLAVNGLELRRQAVTLRLENGWQAQLSWNSGRLETNTVVPVVATIDPDDVIAESNETNNSLRAHVRVPGDPGGGGGSEPPESGVPESGRWGSKLVE